MNARTYRAMTMAEALAAVKRDLGRDAVILRTRSFRKGGLLGLIGGRCMWEVVASPNAEVPARPSPGRYVQLARLPGEAAPIAAAPAAVKPPQPAAGCVVLDADPAETLRKQVGEIRTMVQSLLESRQTRPREVPTSHAAILAELTGKDVEEHIAAELLDQLSRCLSQAQMSNRLQVREKLIDLIEDRIKATPLCGDNSADGRARTIALIGPTGVGKTTTIAKLAANFHLREKRRVGLITVDTYRIAAVDQLRTYARILELPIRAVLSAGELHQAVASMKDLDVILIDTAGRSQNDKARLSQLRGFLAAAEPDEVHLVVSAASSRQSAKRTLERFIPLGANRIIISKVDEAETFGMILTVARANVALSCVTTGQAVPDDISSAQPRQLAGWIVGEGSYAT